MQWNPARINLFCLISPSFLLFPSHFSTQAPHTNFVLTSLFPGPYSSGCSSQFQAPCLAALGFLLGFQSISLFFSSPRLLVQPTLFHPFWDVLVLSATESVSFLLQDAWQQQKKPWEHRREGIPAFGSTAWPWSQHKPEHSLRLELP